MNRFDAISKILLPNLSTIITAKNVAANCATATKNEARAKRKNCYVTHQTFHFPLQLQLDLWISTN